MTHHSAIVGTFLIIPSAKDVALAIKVDGILGNTLTVLDEGDRNDIIALSGRHARLLVCIDEGVNEFSKVTIVGSKGSCGVEIARQSAASV